MKREWKTFGRLAIAACVVAFAGVGCSDDPTGPDNGGGGGSGAIAVESILFNPRSPSPGDTMQVTAVVTGSSAVGDFVRYQWTSNGGQFIENNKTSVRWVAPDTSTFFAITVSASNKVSSVGRTENVFVSRRSSVIGSNAGRVVRTPAGDKLYYLSAPSSPTAPGFSGVDLRVRDAAGDNPVAATRGYQYRFRSDVLQAVHVVGRPNQQRTLRIIDLPSGAITNVPPPTPVVSRVPQFTEPDYSPNGQLITYQGFLPDLIPPAQGGVDTFVVFTYNVNTQVQFRVTVQRNNNFHPTFSPNGNHLVYISDRAGLRQWELYALPVSGNTVPRDSATPPLRLTNSGGRMGADVDIPPDQLKAWNPNPADPVLAILDRDGKLRLVPTDGSGSIVVNIAGRIRDFAWASSGLRLAATTGDILYVVDRSGGVQTVHQAVKGDRMDRLSWSTNGEYIVYHTIRLASAWYELIDFGGSTGIKAPLRITPSAALGEADMYKPLMDTRPVWFASEQRAYYLYFNLTTPRVETMSVAGLAP